MSSSLCIRIQSFFDCSDGLYFLVGEEALLLIGGAFGIIKSKSLYKHFMWLHWRAKLFLLTLVESLLYALPQGFSKDPKVYLDVDPNSILPIKPSINDPNYIITTTPQFPTTTTEKTLYYNNTKVIDPIDELSFHANETLLHVRTESWLLNFDVCLEFKYRIEGKRTRLLVYTCEMTEGGACILEKFLAKPAGTAGDFSIERCHSLRPWTYHNEKFGFHFKFVRRLRKFSDKEKEEAFNRRRRGRRSVREVGRVALAEACRIRTANDEYSSKEYQLPDVKQAPTYNPYELEVKRKDFRK